MGLRYWGWFIGCCLALSIARDIYIAMEAGFYRHLVVGGITGVCLFIMYVIGTLDGTERPKD